MPNLFKITSNRKTVDSGLTKGEVASIKYHDIFDFPLTISEMIRWRASEIVGDSAPSPSVGIRNGFYFVEGKDGIIFKRILRKRISVKKLEIARKTSQILSRVPSVRMVAITGSLAMENSDNNGDIDLMIITKRGMLWTTRALVYLIIQIFGLSTRKPNDLHQKDKLCLNMWLDESDLKWVKGRNAYTAHEIAQIVPLVNKDKTYEKFLNQNRWILKYWPNAVKITYRKAEAGNTGKNSGFIERMAYFVQLNYMRRKITRETITPTRALFHPHEWGRLVLNRINSLSDTS